MSDGGVHLKLYVDYLKNNLAWIRLGWGTIIFHELYMMNRMVGLCHITKYCMSVIKHCIAAGLLSWLGMLTSYQKYKADTCGWWAYCRFVKHRTVLQPCSTLWPSFCGLSLWNIVLFHENLICRSWWASVCWNRQNHCNYIAIRGF